MLFKSKKILTIITMLCVFSFTLIGCGSETVNNDNKEQNKGTVKIAYVEWSCATASSHVMAEILENKMGYEVELIPVTAAVMFEALANGSADACTTVWLPVTHEDYINKVGDKIENLGINCNGAKLALVVPDYVEIDSIEQLNDVKDKFNSQIIGIDPGAGIMKRAENAIRDYNLDYTLMEGSGATMTASLGDAIDKNEWIVVTGWIPHWKFARWDLKTLDDPKKSFGEVEHIDTVVRNGLKDDMPEVYELFDNFQWEADNLSDAMIMATEEGASSKSSAKKWVEENEELVNSWLPDQYQK